jgi:hypothetical protein
MAIPTTPYLEKYNNKIFLLREQLFFLYINLQHGRRLTVYNPKRHFENPANIMATLILKCPATFFHILLVIIWPRSTHVY